ncbi:ankyrin repeat domain-containing protein 29-like [Haliotis rufescens]|uniref:ankyrin repeat domain-containing protein 29-like n=1 Tax=Haliotis rufescens TaxID=6454 RepID=UPI00201E86F5|nr:ankyrin repeat domain-containing protein 29-like [Haliotis rufescens]
MSGSEQSLLFVTATLSPAGCQDLYVASRDGQMTDVKRILSTGKISINCRFGRYSKTPVMWAAYGGHKEVLELLVKKGADVSMVGSGGSNLLFWACQGGHMETVKFILPLNVVDINARTKGGWRAVGWARRQGHQRNLSSSSSRNLSGLFLTGDPALTFEKDAPLEKHAPLDEFCQKSLINMEKLLALQKRH